jgi:hypothetical protein
MSDFHDCSDEEPINQGPASVFAEQASSEDPFQGVPATDKLEAALHYTRAGLKIFPCEPGAKRPDRFTHGFKDASNLLRPLGDHPRLKDFGWYDFIRPDGSELTVTPRDNWAIEPGPAGCTVIDIDPKNGGDKTWAALIAKHGPIVTREVRTPSGGRHLWFSGTISAVNKKLGPGIDTRYFGGYVLLPPSSVNGRPYAWGGETVPIAPLPEWVRESLEAQDERPRRARAQKAWDEFDDDPEGTTAFEEWKAAGGDGGRFDYLLSRIGDEASGGEGFYNPMVSAAGYGVRLGMALDEVVRRIEEVALEAPRGKRTEAYIKDKTAELRRAVRKFRWLDQEARKAEEAEQAAAQEEEVAEEPRPFPGSSEWMSPEDAIDSLRTPIRTWLDRDSAHQKTLTILQSAAGLGKTRTMLEEQQRAKEADRQHTEKSARSEVAQQQRIVDDLWESYLKEIPHDDPEKLQQIKDNLRVQQRLLIDKLLEENLAELPPLALGKLACAVPRQKLAQEIQEDDLKLRPIDAGGEKIPILQGRNASNCKRWELVTKALEKGFEPSALCQNREGELCPFHKTCSTDLTQYLANQAEVKSADNIIITHAHLAIPWLESLALKSRKRVWIDEDVCQTFVVLNEVSDEYLHDLVVTERDFALLEHRRQKHGVTVQALESLAKLSETLLAGLVPPGRLRIEKHLEGWTAAALRKAGRAREGLEELRRGKLDPSLNDKDLSKQIDRVRAPRKLAALFYRLADEVKARSKGEIYSLARNPKTGKITIRGRKPTHALPPNLLLTDATPSPEILAAVFPEYKQELIKIPVRRKAFITQTSEPVFSRNWLLNEGHLPEVVDWIKRLAPHYRDLVVLTTKRIRCALTGEDPKAKLPDFFEIHGARIGHYGNLRGSNKFADCDALVILGREQPNVEDMEELAKAIWYDAAKPLGLVKAINGNKFYRKESKPYRMRDGSKERGEVMVHPDPRVQAVLTATREHELIQAIDRARLIWGEPKDVYILCDIPLPGVEIDRLVPWDVLRGADRLGRAIAELAARGKRALPLSARWLATTFPAPDMWQTEKAAERWLENSSEIKDLRKNPHLSNIYISY